jgi:molybdopterin-guanine dinucleotide biosynthesis protein A
MGPGEATCSRAEQRIWAIVLAGGRAARLGGLSKPDLIADGMRLLDTAVAAASAVARRTVVVGPPGLDAPGAPVVTEDPPFGGPVAGLAAGLDSLDDARDVDDWILVLPVDLPRAGEAVALLLAALPASGPEAVDGLHLSDAAGQPQWLTALYRAPALRAALLAVGDPRGLPMRAVAARLQLASVPDPEGASQDIDTWDDLARHQPVRPSGPPAQP